MQYKLRPLRNMDAFDGEKEKADIPRDIPLQKKCNHKDVQIVSGSEIKCKCGSGWKGPNIILLYSAFKRQA